MVLTESILTNNPCYKEGKKIKVQGLMLEGVRCPQPSAKVFAHNWNRENCDNKCAHAFIDANDGNVVQTLPWNHHGRHCGKHPRTKMSANGTHIGVKMCEPSQIRYKTKSEITIVGNKQKAVDAVERTYNSAVELFAKLCRDFELDPKTAIISQKEGYERGIAALHNDPELLWSSLGLNYSMEGFRQDVMLAMANDKKEPVNASKEEPISIVEPVSVPVTQPEAMIQPVSDEVKEEESKPEPVHNTCKVRINVDNLRIRSTPGVGDNVTGKYTGKGVFEIVKIQNGSGSKKGWGKLGNGAGWISLDFVEML